jgi:hypothetical protein
MMPKTRPHIANDDATEEKGADGLTETERSKIIYRLTVRLILAVVGEAMRKGKLDPIDQLLTMSICSANLSHIDSSPELSRQHAGVLEPNDMRRGISRGGIARSLALPAETVRRRLNALVESGVLIEREDGIIMSAENLETMGTYRETWLFIARQVERLMRDLKARGVCLDETSLPRPGQPPL